MTPPSANSRASARSSTGQRRAVEAGDQQLADLATRGARGDMCDAIIRVPTADAPVAAPYNAAASVENAAHRPPARRDRRPARDQGREPVQDPRVPQRRRHRRRPSADARRRRSTKPQLLRDSRASARTSPRRSARSPRPATRAYPPASCSPSSRRRILDLLRLQGVGPKTVAQLYASSASARSTISRRAARDGRHPRAQGHGRARRRRSSCKALEERKRHAGRHLLADAARRRRGARRRTCASRRPTSTSSPVGSLRRGCETCGDLDILAVGAPPALMDGFIELPAGRARARARRHQVERAAPRRLPGRPAARARREPRRRDAVLHRLEGAQHRAARSRDRSAASS